MDTNEAMALSEAGTSSWVQADQVVAVLAAEVRRLRNERDAALNLAEGYAPVLVQRLRDQMAFDREEGR